MHAGVAELNELLSRAANHARGALRSHEDLHRLLGDVARQLVPPVKAYVSVVLNGQPAGGHPRFLPASTVAAALDGSEPSATDSEDMFRNANFIHYVYSFLYI